MSQKVTILVFSSLFVFLLTTISYSLLSYDSLWKINEFTGLSNDYGLKNNETQSLQNETESLKNQTCFRNETESLKNLRDRLRDEAEKRASKALEKCEIFSGEWVPNPEAPYYTNTTCWEIHEHQNCMKYGRPDSEFMKWRWKPNECELPIFNPFQFLEIMRGKSMAFVGDSIGRNHMQSMICLLSRAEWPIDVSYTDDFSFKRWQYSNYNFTMATFWSPYLVRAENVDSKGDLINIYLDEFDEKWTAEIKEFDYVIINGGQWFLRPIVFYEKKKIVGCQYCPRENVTHLTWHSGYRKAFRTAYKAIINLGNSKVVTILRTYAPSHFENGVWDKGGNCIRTTPFKSSETRLEGYNLELHTIQVQEFKRAEKKGVKRGLKFMLLDTTQAMLLRPDGHPNNYGHSPHQNLTNDCVHWCLPGPIDTLADFLLETLRREGLSSVPKKDFI
ncbi:Trichome birefringence-like family [Vigna unguiculata]|uniref:Trichome birefringence-like family n=2 Tax=Vigna unguiculata TaxID=3917 RepID=A0A4D6LVI3_VIGUN|nr:Trichome birefringence-like family [Vigna unguiculata]